MLISAEGGKVHIVDVGKTSKGAFMTMGDSWLTTQVYDFISGTGSQVALDPFAGQGDMLRVLEEKLGLSVMGLDIDESIGRWETNDSLKSLTDWEVVANSQSRNNKVNPIVVTNPPFLSNYSAKRKSLMSEVGHYFDSEKGLTDLYMVALTRCLESFENVVAIVPETFVSSSYPKNRCRAITILEDNPFEDTTFPICVTCWSKSTEGNPTVYIGEEEAGRLDHLWRYRINPENDTAIKFNQPNGRIGLRAVDGHDPSSRIGFMPAEKLGYDRASIKDSSRLMTYIEISAVLEGDIPRLTSLANEILEGVRRNSHDVVLSGFKGNNKEGKRRRRLDYELARGILERALSESNSYQSGRNTVPLGS